MKGAASALKHAAAVMAAYALFYVLFFAPVLFAGKLLAPGEALLKNVPLYYQPITFWSHDVFCGFPLAADPQAQSFYAPARVLSLIPGSWNVYVVISFTLLSSTAYGFAYSITGSKLAAVTAGLVFGLNAFSIANLRNMPVISTMTWIPVVLWSLERLSKELRAMWIIAGALAVACMWLAGNFEAAAYATVLMAAYVLFLAFSSPIGMWRMLVVSSVVTLFGMGMASLQILPALELAQLSLRWQIPASSLVQFSLPTDQILALLFPFLYGGYRESPYGCDYFGAAPLDTISGYTGMLSLYLVCLALMQVRKDREALFWSITLLLSLVFALGRSGPFAFVFDLLPFFAHFRSHSRLLIETTLAVSVLSALAIKLSYGAETATQKSHTKALITCGVLFALAMTAAELNLEVLAQLARERMTGAYARWPNPALIVPALMLFAGVASFLFWVRCPGDRKLQALLVAALVADLCSFSWFAEWRYRAPVEARLASPPHAARYAEILKKSNQRALCLDGALASADELPPNLSLLSGVASVGGYSALLPARHSKMLKMTDAGVFTVNPREAQAVLDLMAARYVLVPRSKRDLLFPPEKGASKWRFVEEAGEAAVYENTSALPRCWVASSLLSMQPNMVLDTILNKNAQFNPRTLALMDGNFRLQMFRGWEGTHAEIASIDQSSVTVNAVCHGPSILLLSESYYPGWKASVDGKRTEMYQMDYMLQGVPLTRGRHEVKFSYVPQTFYDGALLSALSLFATFFSAPLLSGWKRKLRAGPVSGPFPIH